MSPAPRASLVLLTYNQAAYVQEAARSCLAQDCEPIEIVFSDDHSSDGTWEQLCALAQGYRGPHRLRLRRNTSNLGIGSHYNAAIADSSGALIITAAGDDIAAPERVRCLLAAWDASAQRLDLISSYVYDMDADGVVHGVKSVSDLGRWRSADQWLLLRPHVIGAAHAFTRRLHDHFGPLGSDVRYEDQCMSFRAVALGGAGTLAQPLLRYRRGGLSAPLACAAGQTDVLQQRRLAWVRKYRNDFSTWSQIVRDAQRLPRRPWLLWRARRRCWRARFVLEVLDAGRRLSLVEAWRWGARTGWVWLLRAWRTWQRLQAA